MDHGSDLDTRYPSIVAPDDDCLDDMATDECDPVCQTGLRAAEEIRRTMRVDGRRRRIRDAARSEEEKKQDNKKGLSNNTKEGVNMIFEDEADDYRASDVPEDLQAYPSSSLCRRRSVKGTYPLIAKYPVSSSDRVVSREHQSSLHQFQEHSICALALRLQPF